MRMQKLWLNYLSILILLVSLLVVGTTGFMWIEGWEFIDSLYLTVITLTTVGYSEIGELSTQGRIFNMGLILGGVTTATYAGSRLISIMVSFDFEKRKEMKMKKVIHSMSGHTIVCGFGRMGEVICNELHRSQVKFVVIEKRLELIKRLKDLHYNYVEGDAAHDDYLMEAGIESAKVLVSAVDDDSDGLYIALAGRSMNKDLYIIIRANNVKTKARILRAGANRVILPHIMSGKKVADSVINPAVEDFFDLTGEGDPGNEKLQLADLIVTKNCGFYMKSIQEVGESIHKLLIVGIKRQGGTFEFKPRSDYQFQDGDCVITMGTNTSYQEAKEKFRLL